MRHFVILTRKTLIGNIFCLCVCVCVCVCVCMCVCVCDDDMFATMVSFSVYCSQDHLREVTNTAHHFDTNTNVHMERKRRVKGMLSEKMTATPPLISSRLAPPRSTLAAARHQGAPRHAKILRTSQTVHTLHIYRILGTSQTVHTLHIYRRAEATQQERAAAKHTTSLCVIASTTIATLPFTASVAALVTRTHIYPP